jgi:hypothetical protein
MDESNGYGEDMYGYGNFDEAPGHVHCSKYHKTGHTSTTHNKHKKSSHAQTRIDSTSGRKVRKIYSKLLVAYILHVVYYLLLNDVVFALILPYSNFVKYFRQLQHGARGLPPSSDVLRQRPPSALVGGQAFGK